MSVSYFLGRLFGRHPKMFIAAAVAIGLGAYYLATRPAPPPLAPTLAPIVPAAKAPTVVDPKEAQFRTVVAGARWLKQNMHNPASFELVSATMIDDKAICYEYRGTNSFNAIVLNRRVITDNVNSGDRKEWNKHCAGKSGTDFTHARRAI